MQANPLWPVNTRFPKLNGDIKCEIAIVGGGIAGIVSAYYLQKAGHDVVVIERDEIGSAATGASSGILFYGSGTNFLEAVNIYGPEKAALLWKSTGKLVGSFENLIEKENIECGLRKTGSVMIAKSADDAAYIEKERKALEKTGIKTELLSQKEIENFFTGRKFDSGLHFPKCSQIRPALFAADLAKKSNIQLFENTNFLSYEKGKNISVKTSGGNIECSKLIIATDMEPFFGLEKFFSNESSAIVSSKPMNDIKQIWPEEKILWTVDDSYDIIYPSADRLILEAFSLKGMKEKVEFYYGQKFVMDKQWGDSWAKSRDWLPITGEVDKNIFAAIAMGDQGILMGFLTGSMMPDIIEGKKNNLLDMTSFKRFMK